MSAQACTAGSDTGLFQASQHFPSPGTAGLGRVCLSSWWHLLLLLPHASERTCSRDAGALGKAEA